MWQSNRRPSRREREESTQRSAQKKRLGERPTEDQKKPAQKQSEASSGEKTWVSCDKRLAQPIYRAIILVRYSLFGTGRGWEQLGQTHVTNGTGYPLRHRKDSDSEGAGGSNNDSEQLIAEGEERRLRSPPGVGATGGRRRRRKKDPVASLAQSPFAGASHGGGGVWHCGARLAAGS